MAKLGTWSTTPGSNNSTPPDGWPEGQAPSTVNDCAREMMASIRAVFNDLQYFDHNLTPTFVNATSFTVAGDQTSAIHAGRRLKLFDGTTIYATVTTASFTAVTTINVVNDSGALTSSLSSFALAIVGVNNSPLPKHFSLSSLNVSGAVSIGGATVISGALTVGGALNVAGAGQIAGSLSVGGAVRITGALSVSGSISTNADMSISGNVSIAGRITASGKVTFLGSLSVGGRAHFGNILSVSGATHLDSTLTVGGATVLASTLTIGGVVANVGGGANAELRFEFKNNTGLRYFFLTNTTEKMGFFDAVSVLTRWTSDSAGNFVAAGSITDFSDERLKENWHDLEPDFLQRLATIKTGTYDRTDTHVKQVGISAQELRPILPDAVLEDEHGYLSVAYGKAALVAAVELAREVKDLRRRLDWLEE